MTPSDIAAAAPPPTFGDAGADDLAAVSARAPDAPSRLALWWRAFKSDRLGYACFIIFITLYALSLAAEFVSNDKPLLVYYEGNWYFPIFRDYLETTFGGNLQMLTDYLDPFIREQFKKPGNFALYPLNPYTYDTVVYYSRGEYHPGAPTWDNWLGTDTTGRDVLSLVIYGFRISVTFALALTAAGTVLGILIGAVQGYFAGKVDLVTQRLIEVWGSMPELYLLLIFAAIFQQSFLLLFVLMTMFGWVNVSDYVRAEFLRNRQMEYVTSGRALGLSSGQLIWRHILPNSLTPVITFLPFRMSAGITALASLDFLGLGVNDAPSLGRLLLRGKETLHAWWISLSAFSILVLTILLLTFIGEALRQSLDSRAAKRSDEAS